MRIQIHPEARTEVRLAALHYESRRPGLGVRFVEAVMAAVSLICESPTTWPIVEGAARRCLIRLFPYAVLYLHLQESDIIRIVAVVAQKRRPGYWRGRR